MENAIFTNMCMILDDKGNVLVQNRTDLKWPGIAFPGGHVDAGEPFADAVVREIYEETGLHISNLQLCGIKNWIRDNGTRYVVFLYKTSTFDGELKSSDEGEVFWLPLEELSKKDLAKGMEVMLELYRTGKYTEQFYVKEEGKWKLL